MIYRVMLAALLGSALSAGAARADVVVAAAGNATVQPAGPRLGNNGLRFFNVEGSANGTFASYGVIDFFAPATPGASVTGLTLALTQNNAAFTSNGALRFFVSENTATSIAQSASPLTYDAGFAPNGLGAQLAPLVLLGAGSFSQASSGQEDDFRFPVSGLLANYLTSELAVGGDVRIVVAPDSASVAATYSGFNNTGAERLTLATSAAGGPAVPEPMSLALLAPALGMLAVRRRAGKLP